MENPALQKLLTDHVKDLYDAEKQLTKALPKMAKAAGDEELSQGFKEHAEQTRGHVQRLEQVFEALGMKARSKPCAGMKGLVEEGQEIIQEEEGASLDLSLCSAARKVEHYEMVGYNSLISMAQAARQPDVVKLLQETLAEETETDKRLATIAKRLIKETMQADRQSAPGAKSRAEESSGRGGRSKGSNGRGSNLSETTTDPEEIRQWAEERGGKPACVKGTGGKGDIGVLRLEFPGKPNANDSKLQPISWEDFFEKFEERGLAMVYQKNTASGKQSNFNKLIARETQKPKARTAR